MYIKQYNNKGELIGYKKGNTFYTLNYNLPENAEIDEGEKPTSAQIEITQALNELSSTDSKVPRIAEDFYDVLTDEQKSKLDPFLVERIEDKKAKRQAYLELL